MDAEQSYRVGLIGLGSIGQTHAKALRQLEGVDLVAYSGGTPGRITETGWPDAEQLDAQDLLGRDDIDIVAIASPSEAHGAQTLRALESGKHVVVEKPMATTVADADAIVALSESSGLLVTPLAQRRLEPEHVHLKRLLDEDRLGTIVLGETFVHWTRDDAYYAHAPWRTSMAGGGGSLMNQGLHNVDLLAWLLGPVVEVTAQTATRGRQMEAEDTTVATLRFASGALGAVITTTAAPPGEPAEISVRTTSGSARLTQDGVADWTFPGIEPPEHVDPFASGAADPAAIGTGGHQEQWQNMITSLRNGTPPSISARDGRDTVRLLCAIYQAAATGAAVRPEDLT